jgi:hypothetical protein
MAQDWRGRFALFSGHRHTDKTADTVCDIRGHRFSTDVEFEEWPTTFTTTFVLVRVLVALVEPELVCSPGMVSSGIIFDRC